MTAVIDLQGSSLYKWSESKPTFTRETFAREGHLIHIRSTRMLSRPEGFFCAGVFRVQQSYNRALRMYSSIYSVRHSFVRAESHYKHYKTVSLQERHSLPVSHSSVSFTESKAWCEKQGSKRGQCNLIFLTPISKLADLLESVFGGLRGDFSFGLGLIFCSKFSNFQR